MMKKKKESFIQLFIIGLGLFIGVYFSKISYQEHEKLGHAELQGHQAMSHGNYDISQEAVIPKIVDFKVLKDPMSGWNINLEVADFHFAPEHASQTHQEGEGHAHLYVNGNKIARLYGNWFHILEFVKAKNEVKVTLNTNDHQTLIFKGQPIERKIVIEQ